MQSRLSRLEAIIPTLATKADLASLECRFHKELSVLGLRIVLSMASVLMLSFSGVFYIARYVH